jgi:hypothetical protein
MSTLKIDELKNNGSAIDLPNGIKVGGNEIVQGYTSSGTEPASPVTGDFWWDSTNELLYQYVNGEFKAITVANATVIWDADVNSFTATGVQSVSTGDTTPMALAFSTDGTRMFVIGDGSNRVYQYNLTTGFDVTTASYSSFFSATQEATPGGLAFNTDGTKMYIVGITQDKVFQYSLSTAWDITTTSYDSVSFSVTSQETFPEGLTFNPDGTKMFVIGRGTDKVYQYDLSTAFDISTASYNNVNKAANQDAHPHDLAFNTEGTKMYMMGGGNSTIYQYNLTTGFDISTMTYSARSFSVVTQEGAPRGLTFSADGTKCYVVGIVTDKVWQFSTGL